MATTPQQLSDLSKCFDCIPKGMRDVVLIYILAQIVGITDPQTLVTNARCYDCIPVGLRSAASLYLDDAILSGDTPEEDTMTSLGLTAGITAFWKMDEDSGDRADVSGNGRTLTQQGAVGADAGLLNNAALLAGDPADHLSSASAGLSTGGSTITVSCWVKLNSVAADQTLLGKFTGGFTPDGWRLMYDFDNGVFYFESSDSGIPAFDGIVSTVPVSAGVWYHIVAGFDGVMHFMSVNAGARETDDGLPASTAADDFMIGRDGEGLATLDGLIDEVGIWVGTVLTDEQVTQLYNSGSPLPYS